jgi:hypothetical protein
VIADLLAECAAHPDDDQPRLVWGDAIGGERGELVAIQCASRDALPPGELAALNRRERELLERAWEWSGLAGLVHRVRFRRGFVDAIDVGAEAYLVNAERIAAIAPLVTAITLRGVGNAETLQRVLDVPQFARVRALDLVDRVYFDAANVLARAGALPHLVALGLGLRDGMGFELAAAAIGHIERLRLYTRLDADEISAIGQVATSLVAFAGRFSDQQSNPFASGFPRLVDLALHDVGEDWFVFALPLADRLERLTVVSLDDREPRPKPHRLRDFVKLRALDLSAGAFAPGSLGVLATSAPASLRELRLGDRDAAAVTEVAVALAPQLDLLDLRAAVRIDPVSCAGDTLVDEPIIYELFHAGPVSRGEWRPHGSADGPQGSPAWLVAESGHDTGRIWDLTEHPNIYLGRSVMSHVALFHETIARRHAQLSYRDGRHHIRDLRSTNGTSANGIRLDGEIALADNTPLELGASLLRFFTGAGGGARASALSRHLEHFDGRTGLPRARPERVGAILEIQSTWSRDFVAAELARRLVAAAGPDVTVTWLGNGRFGVTPGDRAEELAAACAGEVTLADDHVPASLRVVV